MQTTHDDAIIISMMIANYNVKKKLIDNRSLPNVLFYNSFQRMKLSIDRLRKVNTSLVRFSRDSMTVEGEITLSMTVRQEP